MAVISESYLESPILSHLGVADISEHGWFPVSHEIKIDGLIRDLD